MFSDGRSKRLVIVSHCILNQNSISDSTADFPSQFQEIVKLLIDNNIGIIQLRCPEILCLGLNRMDDQGCKRELLTENSRIRKLLEYELNLKRIRNYVKDVLYEIAEYKKYGFEILGIIGVNRSPSCGINTTSKNNEEISGYGVLMNELKLILEKERIEIPMIGTKTSEVDESVKTVQALIAGKY